MENSENNNPQQGNGNPESDSSREHVEKTPAMPPLGGNNVPEAVNASNNQFNKDQEVLYKHERKINADEEGLSEKERMLRERQKELEEEEKKRKQGEAGLIICIAGIIVMLLFTFYFFIWSAKEVYNGDKEVKLAFRTMVWAMTHKDATTFMQYADLDRMSQAYLASPKEMNPSIEIRSAIPASEYIDYFLYRIKTDEFTELKWLYQKVSFSPISDEGNLNMLLNTGFQAGIFYLKNRLVIESPDDHTRIFNLFGIRQKDEFNWKFVMSDRHSPGNWKLIAYYPAKCEFERELVYYLYSRNLRNTGELVYTKVVRKITVNGQ